MNNGGGEVSIEEALRRGFWTVTVPSLVALLVPIAIFVIAAKLGYIPGMGYAGMKWALPTFFVAFFGSWLTWSIQVPRWRVWAYRRVKDVALLKQRAVEANLIWPDSSLLTRTELMSPTLRDELRKMERAA